MRPNTERPITITHGTNRLVAREDLVTTFLDALKSEVRPAGPPPLWDGKAGPRIADLIVSQYLNRG
jgi:UDP-N-acetylglucosamine 2-epimerase (non-hydrolysing)